MTDNPEVISSPVGLVTTNALVCINGLVYGLAAILPSLCIRTKSNPCDPMVFTKQGCLRQNSCGDSFKRPLKTLGNRPRTQQAALLEIYGGVTVAFGEQLLERIGEGNVRAIAHAR
jgi:hypothetical protein